MAGAGGTVSQVLPANDAEVDPGGCPRRNGQPLARDRAVRGFALAGSSVVRKLFVHLTQSFFCTSVIRVNPERHGFVRALSFLVLRTRKESAPPSEPRGATRVALRFPKDRCRSVRCPRRFRAAPLTSPRAFPAILPRTPEPSPGARQDRPGISSGVSDVPPACPGASLAFTKKSGHAPMARTGAALG